MGGSCKVKEISDNGFFDDACFSERRCLALSHLTASAKAWFRLYASARSRYYLKMIYSKLLVLMSFWSSFETITKQGLHSVVEKLLQKRAAFTLAEVLIVLGIIGLVADMTIPTLINKTQDKQLKVMWKKTYSDMSNAARLMSIDQPTMNSELQVAEAFSKYIKNVRYCDTEKAVEQGCWPDNTPVYTKAKTKYVNNPGLTFGGASCMNIVNGSLMCFDQGGNKVIFYFDVNGAKLPNTIGKDIFAAVFHQDLYSLKPVKGIKTGWGAADGDWVELTSGDGTCNGPQSDSQGWGCSAELLLQ